MRVPFYRVNAFVDIDTPCERSSTDAGTVDLVAVKAMHTGNPAAVILLTQEQDSHLTDERRQAIAHELNLSETSFVVSNDSASSNRKNNYGLRWFTPKAEVNLCGHATLAAMAAILQHHDYSPPPPPTTTTTEVHFETLYSGTLTVTGAFSPITNETLSPSGRGTKYPLISMHFPAYLRHDPLTSTQSSHLLSALRLSSSSSPAATATASAGVHVVETFMSDADVVVHLSRARDVLAVAPDFKALGLLSSWVTRGVIVCALDADEIVSRFFAPAVGIDEDPVTGSAHCALAPLFVDVGAPAAAARQMSKRTGRLSVERRTREVVVISGRTSVVVDGFIEI